MFNKRGEVSSASNIATLISLIALFMLVYILLLPQEARDELLKKDQIDGITPSGEGVSVSFSKFIGDVIPLLQSRTITHTIAGANLFSNVESEIVPLASNIVVSRGAFRENSQNLDFLLEFPKDVKKIELYLIVEEASGNLIVELNGRPIFNSEVSSNSQELITLPLAYLLEVNTLTFKSSSTGGAFWSTNKHELKEIKLRKQVELKNREAIRTLAIPSEEITDLQKALLRFSVYCSNNEDESLIVKLNGNRIYSDTPFCNLRQVEVEIPASYIKEGANEIAFESEGDYTIEEIEFESLLKGESAKEYVFNLEEKDYLEVRRGSRDIFLTFDFAVSEDRKSFDVFVNDKEFNINTDKSSYMLTISDYIEKEVNIIKLRPRNSFEIIEMRVELD